MVFQRFKLNIFQPNVFKVSNNSLAYKIIEENVFSTVVTSTKSEPFISQIPLYLSECKTYLMGHIAKANPHRRLLTLPNRTTAIFHGPHHYISPTWYEDHAENVPTWNYASIFVNGVIEQQTDAKKVLQILAAMTSREESANETNWELNVDSIALEKMVELIFFFRLQIQSINGKFKLSQNKPKWTRETISRKLFICGTDLAKSTSTLMHLVNNEPSST